MFNPSILQRIPFRPWRWATPPTYDGNGIEITPGTKQGLAGVFILIDDAIIDKLASVLPFAQKTEFRGWIYRVTVDEAGEWHVPVWSGDNSAVFIRVPAALWNNPTGAPPAKVKTYFGALYRAAA